MGGKRREKKREGKLALLECEYEPKNGPPIQGS